MTMQKQVGFLIAIIALALIPSGCMRAISKELRAQVEAEINIDRARKDYKSYEGKMVIWGGVVVKAENLKEGTLLEVVQKPLNSEERPRDVDQSEGRFLALYKGYLDVAIYAEGREVTVAGRLTGIKEKLLGEIDYTYPVVTAQEVYLWPPRREIEPYGYPHWYYYPYWWYYPYRFDPWYW